MNPQTLEYLKQDELGKVVAKGLANLYTNKPQKPVRYLAQWLFTYSSNRRQMKKMVEQQNMRSTALNVFQQAAKVKQLNIQQNKKIQQSKVDKINAFKKMIQEHNYHFELFEEQLPQFIEEQTQITGAYIGELNYPIKQITEEDQDENAHLDEKANKLINYIGSSISHKQLMRNKVLELTQGVTPKAFTLDEDAPPAEEGQEQPLKQKYIYIPNVVKNQAMHYFRIPKLGAYLAIPLVYQSYLTEKIFDVALEAKNKYNKELQQFEAKRKQQVEALTTQKQQVQKKINELKEKNAEQSQLEPDIAELARIEEEIRTKNAQKFEEVEPELPIEKSKFVICVDNLGKDKELSSADIQFITELVQHFKNSWINKQKQLLANDVKIHIQLLKALSESPDIMIQNLDKQLEEMDEQKTEEINQIDDQTLKQYKQQEYTVNKLKGCIQKNEKYLKNFMCLKDFRVIKYRNVIQNILYLLGHSKDQVNEPGKAILHWKLVKEKYITEENFNKILNYVMEGPKQGEFKPYAKTPVLSALFDDYDESAIFKYNPGLGVIVKFIKTALKHRISNVELRKAQKEKERNQRNQILQENQKIANEKTKELEQLKETTPPEELENFNEEEWSAKYDETHPPKQVPPEVVDDVDNDM